MPQALQVETFKALGSIEHGFFTREGGVSEGIYASLNVGFGTRDERSSISTNRARVAARLGFPQAPLNTLYQVHSSDVVVIDAPFDGDPPRADGLVTTTPGVIIGALAADCTPILFVDPLARVIGAAHAGWRGALSGIIEATLATMCEVGGQTGRIHAAIGPTISQANYEVGPEFEAHFLAVNPDFGQFFQRPQPGSRPHFDLPGFVAHRLSAAGVATIDRNTLCTYENESRLFSYRRSCHRSQDDYGRQISAIVLK